MSEKKIVVPAGMLRAVAQAVFDEFGRCDYHPKIRIALEAAVRWLAENPIVPTPEQSAQLAEYQSGFGHNDVRNMQGSFGTSRDYPMLIAVEWQRRMFLGPEPEVPEAVKDVMAWFTVYLGSNPEFENIRRNVLLAYRRGTLSQNEK